MRGMLIFIAWILLVLSAESALAQDATTALRFPLDRFPVIPDKRGITFFYGRWKPGGRSGGGARTISDGKIVYEITGAATPFRVLLEGENFALVAALRRYDSVWTDFVIFVLEPYSASDPNDSGMITWYCNDFSMDGGDHAFAWSRQRLLNLFAATCATTIEKGETWPFGNGWSGIGYTRYSN